MIIARGDPEDLPPRSDQLISSGWEVASLPGEIHIYIYVFLLAMKPLPNRRRSVGRSLEADPQGHHGL